MTGPARAARCCRTSHQTDEHVEDARQIIAEGRQALRDAPPGSVDPLPPPPTGLDNPGRTARAPGRQHGADAVKLTGKSESQAVLRNSGQPPCMRALKKSPSTVICPTEAVIGLDKSAGFP